MNTFKELGSDLWPIVPYIGQWILNGINDVRKTLVVVLTRQSRRKIKNALPRAVWQLFRVLLHYPAQIVLTVGSLVINAFASLHPDSVRRSALTIDALNRLTGFELADDEFAQVQNAHKRLSGSRSV